MNAAEIRQQFLRFFEENGHTIVASSSLVPGNDPTLLFTNSGMVQFKDVFLGVEKRPYVRAVSVQRCLRAGGKHNDLENVGYTARHHTFFEMLGNWSFGDYFKREAIRYAWELLTRVYGLPPEKLWATVYIDDDEAYDIWTKDIGVPAERCVRIGDNKGAKYASDNFWQMADTGPCGPCSEIFYDHGPEVWGGPPGSPEAEGDRYIEIWNLVFMQFDRDAAGKLTPLPAPCVDTGMGLERLAAVLQHVHSNYEIDLFQDLIRAAVRETGAKDYLNPSLRVIADHIRACAFLIVDGVIPGNEGRGYVLRRIIRRAIRHGYQLGQRQPFFHKLVEDLDRAMGDAYPELRKNKARVAQVLKQEEERFGETLEHGMKILNEALAAVEKSGRRELDGETAFTLYDTFGFPFDLTADVCRERGVTVDEAGFEAAMDAQRERARAASQFKVGAQLEYSGPKTHFRGYDTLSERGPRRRALPRRRAGRCARQRRARHRRARRRRRSTRNRAGRSATAASSPRAAPASRFSPSTTRRRSSPTSSATSASVKTGELQGRRHGRGERRSRGARAHDAQSLGDAPDAQGAARGAGRPRPAEGLAGRSRQDALRLRAQRADDRRRDPPRRGDRQPRDPRQRADAGARDADRGGAEVRRGDAVRREVRRRGARARHRQLARILRRHARRAHRRHRLLQDRRRRRRGRRHPPRRGGHRRERARLGAGAGGAASGGRASALKVPVAEIDARIAQLQESARSAEKELARLKSKAAASAGDDLAGSAVDVKGAKVLAVTLDGADAKALRETMDKLKDKLKSAAIVLSSVADGKVTLIAGVTADLTAKVKAGELVNHVAQQVGGKGGGRPDMAQAGGTDPAGLPAALKSVAGWVEQRL